MRTNDDHLSDRYWDRQLETLPLDELAHVQDHRLQWQVQRCWLGSPFYRERIERAGLGQRDVRSRADLARLPVLTDRELRADLRSNPPLGSATVAPAAWWAEQQPLDGPDGGTLVLTDGDVIHRTGLAARALWAFGARPGGAELSIDVRMDGPAARAGAAAAVDAAVAKIRRDSPGPAGGVDASRTKEGRAGSDQSRHTGTPATPSQATWLLGVPSNGLHTPAPDSFEPYVALGHPRVGPTLAFECEARTGLHWPLDHYLLEVVEPATFAPLPERRVGALLVTHLTREGSPLIRYWTGYETRLDTSPCPCGRTGARSAALLPARPITEEG